MLGTIGDSILVLPVILADKAKQDAWLSMLLSIVFGMAIGGIFAAIANRMGRRSIFDAVSQAGGRWLGSIVVLLLLFEYFMCSLSLLSEMSQFMTTQLMPETPVNAIMLLFLAVVIIACRYGVEAFARMGELLYPFMVGLCAVLVILLLPQVNVANLKPYVTAGPVPIMHGGFIAFTFVFTEMVILLSLVPHVSAKDGAKLTKPILSGLAFGGAVLVVTVLFCVLVLGPSLMVTKYYSTFVLAQKIQIGHFLERLEAIFAFLWIITVFYKTLLLFFSMTEGIGCLLGLRENRMLTIPLGMMLLVWTSAGTPNITVYNAILTTAYPWFDLTFCAGLPVLLLAILLIGGRSRPRTAQASPSDGHGRDQPQGQP